MKKPNTYSLDLQLFAEDKPEEQTPPKQEEVDPNKKYLDTIKDLKANTVDKKKYEELEAQNKELLNRIVNGGPITQSPPQEEKPDIKQLREKLFKGESNNLEYAKTMLKLRKAIMDEGGIDPFVPVGEKYVPDNSDLEAAERVATVLQECIDASEGDSGVFTNLLQLKTIDVMPTRGKRK